jgi:hypothetical protein
MKRDKEDESEEERESRREKNDKKRKRSKKSKKDKKEVEREEPEEQLSTRLRSLPQELQEKILGEKLTTTLKDIFSDLLAEIEKTKLESQGFQKEVAEAEKKAEEVEKENLALKTEVEVRAIFVSDFTLEEIAKFVQFRLRVLKKLQ